MSIPRPVPGNPVATYASLTALCEAADKAATLLAELKPGLSDARAALASEAAARSMADAGLRQALDALAATLQARAAALQDQIEARATGAGVQGLADELHGTIAAAASAHAAQVRALADELRGSLAAEVRARIAQVQALADALRDGLATEASARAGADRDLERMADALGARADALAAALDDERARRTAAITAAASALQAATDAVAAALADQRLDYVPKPGRPGDAPGRFTVVASAAALAGPRARLPFLPPELIARGEAGAVVRIGGAAILAGRAAQAAEIGRLYRARYVIQRRADPADPTGDAVVCGIVHLDQSLRVLGPVAPMRTYPALVTAHGRQECQALMARGPGLGAAFQVPPAARFLVPVVVLHGLDGLTDIEVLDLDDVTEAFVLAPPVAEFEARLAALESADLAQRLQVLESAVGTPGTLTFGSKGDAAHARIPDGVQVVTLLGRRFAGDGGGGRYVRTAEALAPGADSFTAHGAVFLRETVAPDVVAGMLESGFEAWMAGLPTEPPRQSGRRWSDHGVPAVTP